MNDGYKMVPLEISAFYLIPFSTQHFNSFSVVDSDYTLANISDLGDVAIQMKSKNRLWNSRGNWTDYVIYDFISVHGQMRFRDLNSR